jgi:hypothetical protein
MHLQKTALDSNHFEHKLEPREGRVSNPAREPEQAHKIRLRASALAERLILTMGKFARNQNTIVRQ